MNRTYYYISGKGEAGGCYSFSWLELLVAIVSLKNKVSVTSRMPSIFFFGNNFLPTFVARSSPSPRYLMVCPLERHP